MTCFVQIGLNNCTSCWSWGQMKSAALLAYILPSTVDLLAVELVMVKRPVDQKSVAFGDDIDRRVE